MSIPEIIQPTSPLDFPFTHCRPVNWRARKMQHIMKREEQNYLERKTAAVVHVRTLQRKLSETQTETLEQKEVLIQTEMTGKLRHAEDRKKALAKLKDLGIPRKSREAALDHMIAYLTSSPITLNFDGRSLEKVERIGKNQKLDKLWNAPKGVFNTLHREKRNLVEQRLHGFYKQGDQDAINRPHYLALNVGNSPSGAASYYGGCYFELKPEATAKSTFTAADSFSEQIKKTGYQARTGSHFEYVIASMKTDAFKLLYEMATGKVDPRPLPDNQYIEAQVIGLTLSDISKLVLDRSEIPIDSEIEKKWIQLAKTHGFEVQFYDKKGWVDTVITSGLAKANQIQHPTIKGHEKIIADPTQFQVDQFMDCFGLVTVPNVVSLGMGNMKKWLGQLTNSYNSLNPPKISENTYFGRLLSKTQAYIQRSDAIKPFANKNEEGFSRFKNGLPTTQQVKKAKEDLEIFKITHPQKPLSKKDRARLERLENTYHKLYEREKLRQQIGDFSFDDLLTNPIAHSRSYVFPIGEFRDGLDKNNHAKMIGAAKELARLEKNYQAKLETLIAVLSDEEFLKTVQNKEMALTLKQIVKQIKQSDEIVVSMLGEFAQSVENDPEGWRNAIK